MTVCRYYEDCTQRVNYRTSVIWLYSELYFISQLYFDLIQFNLDQTLVV